jgi:carbonic anhydrase
MEKSFQKLLDGYQSFRDKYASEHHSVMCYLSHYGQHPETMVVACCDSRVDPALILQCDPGDLFVVRNVANIVPPYEKDEAHHGTSAALEFGICGLNVKHLILLGHSQCGGIKARFKGEKNPTDDFINNWVSLIPDPEQHCQNIDDYAKQALLTSYQHALTFPWLCERVEQGALKIHLWFFDISAGQIFTYNQAQNTYLPLTSA